MISHVILRNVTRLLILLILASVQGLPASEPKSKPNIVFILADDLGWADLGCYGSTFYETPNLDNLAKEGMRFTASYAASSVCSPTRASIITGKYPARLNLTDWLPGRGNKADQKLKGPDISQSLPPQEFSFAKALKSDGYRTAFMGKWHLGESPECWPEHHGFDVNIAGCGAGQPHSYFSPYGFPNLPDGPAGEYLNDRLTEEALKFIESSKKTPFLLFLPHYAVHLPLQAKSESVERFNDKAAGLPSHPKEFIKDYGRQVRQVQNNATYAAMIESLDQSVGQIMNKLTELGIDTNTIIIFSSDNGGTSTSKDSPTSNLPLRGGKGWPYEGGIREPLIIKWPGVTRPDSLCRAPVISTDFYPTLLEMAGLPPLPKQHLDGVSIVPALRGKPLCKRSFFWHYPHYSNQGGSPHGVVRSGDYKLIEWYEDMRTELYNLAKDLGEQHDLASTMPEKTLRLRTELHDWRKEVNARMPIKNPNYVP